jgi:hypothetical protein
MIVEQLSPEVAEVELGDVTRRLREAPVDEPFAQSRMDFCAALSKALLGDAQARDYPDLQAAGFTMRPAAVAQLRDEFMRLNPPELIALPRGIVFHIPPSNVGTVLLYSWLYSFLAGNTNVVRAGSADSPQWRSCCGSFGRPALEPPCFATATIVRSARRFPRCAMCA